MKLLQMAAVAALCFVAAACGDKNQPSEDQLKQAIAARAGGATQIVKFHKVSCQPATSSKAPVAAQCVAQLQTEHNPLGAYWDQPLEMEVLATSEDHSHWTVADIVRADPVKK